MTTPAPQDFTELRVAESAILTRVQVGAQSVAIDGFGTFGRIATSGNVKWLIFTATSSGTSAGALLSYQTAPTSLAAGTAAWQDSPALSFTLQANTTYFLGLMATQQFEYHYDYPGTAVSGGGLTLPTGVNGNASGFAAPVAGGNGSVLHSLRVSAVPEPAALSIAVLAGGLLTRRLRR